MDWNQLAQDRESPVGSSREEGNKPSDSRNDRLSVYQLSDYKILNASTVCVWNYV